MNTIFTQTQLYTFLLYCDDERLEKTVLDCGAGGRRPPLAIFKDKGFETYGIDISQKQIEFAKEFEEKEQIELNITEGNMLELPFEDESMSYIYSYNSIFHMCKEEIGQAVSEIKRVLKKDGLAFINFPTVDDWRARVGERVREGEYLQEEFGEKILHSYFKIDEAEIYFNDVKIIYKEVRKRNGYMRNGRLITRGFVDYIIQKL
ncbi:class I SAM-dependent methyltransferase [Vallitalea guaymasensis]|uniref:class I SAM-dependent methyltransferase n=1 Tax=Vallitalea guaymasensis TaxID=1185412 RepID=UPI002356F442|nr:class I SAM-dependent methyltransferase [Vallitalea guaymasensis]